MPSANHTLKSPQFSRRQNAAAWPQKFSCKFIEPGLVHYDDHGTVLVRKETLDKMAASFIGRPVINETHKDVSPNSFEEDADGIVTNVRYESDGWYWADFLVWDDATKRNCMSKAYSVSCAYDVKDFKSQKSEHNNIPYGQEVLDGEYTHLAIVANPRYEDARIVVNNSKGGSDMINLKFWKKGKKDLKNAASEMDIEKATVVVNGKDVPVTELINAFKEEEALRETENAEGHEPLSDDTIVEIDGKETPIKNLVEAYNAKAARIKNAEDEEKKKKDEEEAANRKNAEDEEKKKAEEKEKEKAENAMKCAECGTMKNSKDDSCKPCEEKKALENGKGDEHFNNLKSAADRRGAPQEIRVTSQRDRLEEGKKRYGAPSSK